MKEAIIIILLSLILVCIIPSVIAAAMLAFDMVYNKYKHNVIASAINKCIIYLLLYCETRNIPVLFESEIFNQEENKNAIGKITYIREIYKTTGKLACYKNFIIHIRESRYSRFAYATLAHEIGHYISIVNYGDDSESGADYEAKKLIESFLTKKELKAMKTELDIFFEHDPVVHTEPMEYVFISKLGEYLYSTCIKEN